MNEEEIRTRLLSTFMEGMSVAELDNLPSKYATRVDKLIDEAIRIIVLKGEA